MRRTARFLAGSCIVSCDNAHAVHPNHTEYRDPNHCVYMNGGVVIKYNSNKRYTTDSLSEAFFRLICGEAGVPVQLYANRAVWWEVLLSAALQILRCQ